MVACPENFRLLYMCIYATFNIVFVSGFWGFAPTPSLGLLLDPAGGLFVCQTFSTVPHTKLLAMPLNKNLPISLWKSGNPSA